MLNQIRRQHSGNETGFTLIELLVVIIILGILAAVVVFAVSGVGDRGKEASVVTDEKTIRTAQEAYCAQNGKYASGQELVVGGLLSELPQYHTVAAQNAGGPCNGWTFSTLRTTAAGANPGSWEPFTGPPNAASRRADVMRMRDGRVIALISDFPNGLATAVWDPEDDQWTPGETGPAAFEMNTNGYELNTALLLQEDPATPESECNPNCDKVLLRGTYCPDGVTGPACSAWFLFDPNTQVGQWSQLQRGTSVSNTSYSNKSLGNHLFLVQLRDNPNAPGNDCAPNCGKVVITARDAASGTPTPELYDPKTNVMTPFSCDDSICSAAHLAKVSLLQDGRVLYAGRTGTNVSTSRLLDPKTLQFTVGLAPTGRSEPINSPEPPRLANGEIYLGQPSTNVVRFPEIYAPQASGLGSFRSTQRMCDPNFVTGTSNRCHILGSLPDGRILAYSSTNTCRPCSGATTGRAYVFDVSSNTWAPTGDLLSQDLADGVLLDPRTGPCGRYCNKMMVLGSEGGAALYTP